MIDYKLEYDEEKALYSVFVKTDLKICARTLERFQREGGIERGVVEQMIVQNCLSGHIGLWIKVADSEEIGESTECQKTNPRT